MHTQQIHEVLTEAIVGRHLLTHPFYRRWEAGTLSEGELAAYAEQYRHIERELPVTLAAIADALPEGRARELVEANLADELGSPEPHAELFESFARAAGAAPEVPATPRRPRCSPSCARRRRTIPWPRWPWSPPTRSRRPTSRGRRRTACAATTASTRRAPVSGTSTAPRRWTTPAGRWRRSRSWAPIPSRAGRRARVGRLVVAVPQRARGAGAGRAPC